MMRQAVIKDESWGQTAEMNCQGFSDAGWASLVHQPG